MSEILVSDWWNWAHFRTNFRKFWKYDPYLYQFLHWIRGHRYTRRLILRPISAARPRIDLCTKNPPRDNDPLFEIYWLLTQWPLFFFVFLKWLIFTDPLFISKTCIQWPWWEKMCNLARPCIVGKVNHFEGNFYFWDKDIHQK